MLIVHDLIKVILGNSVAICFVFAWGFSFISPIAAQPTSFRDFNPPTRKAMTQDWQAEIDKLTQRIKTDDRNVALYKERIRRYSDLLELNFDNSDWEIYADKVEADLSRLVELEGTAEALTEHGYFLRSCLETQRDESKKRKLSIVNYQLSIVF